MDLLFSLKNVTEFTVANSLSEWLTFDQLSSKVEGVGRRDAPHDPICTRDVWIGRAQCPPNIIKFARQLVKRYQWCKRVGAPPPAEGASAHH